MLCYLISFPLWAGYVANIFLGLINIVHPHCRSFIICHDMGFVRITLIVLCHNMGPDKIKLLVPCHNSGPVGIKLTVLKESCGSVAKALSGKLLGAILNLLVLSLVVTISGLKGIYLGGGVSSQVNSAQEVWGPHCRFLGNSVIGSGVYIRPCGTGGLWGCTPGDTPGTL